MKGGRPYKLGMKYGVIQHVKKRTVGDERRPRAIGGSRNETLEVYCFALSGFALEPIGTLLCSKTVVADEKYCLVNVGPTIPFAALAVVLAQDTGRSCSLAPRSSVALVLE